MFKCLPDDETGRWYLSMMGSCYLLILLAIWLVAYVEFKCLPNNEIGCSLDWLFIQSFFLIFWINWLRLGLSFLISGCLAHSSWKFECSRLLINELWWYYYTLIWRNSGSKIKEVAFTGQYSGITFHDIFKLFI